MSNNFGIADPHAADLVALTSTDEGKRALTCYIDEGGNEYGGSIGVRISSVFVVLVASTITTAFPVMATRLRRVNIPLYLYLFARYFGAGVIVATAFIHLLDPAYEEIGPASCVGMTAGWREYSWPPALALTSSMLVFLLEFLAHRYVEKKYGEGHGVPTRGSRRAREDTRAGSLDAAALRYEMSRHGSADRRLSTLEPANRPHSSAAAKSADHDNNGGDAVPPASPSDEESLDALKERTTAYAFKQQFAAFLILEFGIIFHSVIIGLTLATAAPHDFAVLYPVIVFHQAFEGLGIGARLSAIPFPRKMAWMPWLLVGAYGVTTPVAIAAGLGVRTTYDPASFTANVVSGVLDSISAGILLYTGFVELLARDFLFNPERTDDDKQLAWMVASVFLGVIIMALLGKWA